MNKVFKVIWNHATQTWTAVSELGHAKGKTKSKKIVKLTALAGAVIGSLAVSQTATAASDLTTNDAVNISPNNVPNPTAGRQAVAVGAKASALKQDSIAIGTNATANWTNTISIGKDTVSTKDHAVAIGTSANASGVQAVTVGSYARADADSSISLGQNATVSGTGSTAAVAVGFLANASAANTVAAGKSATATVDNAVALGVSSSATNRNAAALGAYSKAAGDRATAVGAASNAEGAASFAGGTSAKAIGDNSIAIGGATVMDDDYLTDKKQTAAHAAKANGKKSIAIGFNATTSEEAADSVVMGTFANANAPSAVVIGQGALADGNGDLSVAIGRLSKARDIVTVAIGDKADAHANSAIALGANASASGISIGGNSVSSMEDSMALGHGSESLGSETVTIGYGASSAQDVSYAVTLGAMAQNSANYSTALGHSAKTTEFYSVALGANSEAGKDFVSSSNATINGVEYENFAASTSSFNTENDEKEGGAVVSLGKKGYERQIKHVAAGQVTNVSTDAINGSQLYAVADSLATKINKQHWNVGNNDGAVVSGVYHEDQVNFVNGNVTTVNITKAPSKTSTPDGGPNITNVSYDVNVGKGLKIENKKIVANFVAGNGVTFNEDGDKITINAQSTGGAASSVVSGSPNTLSVRQNATNPSEYIVTAITGSLAVPDSSKGKVVDDAVGQGDNSQKLTTIQTTRDMINKAHWNLQIAASSDPNNQGEANITSANKDAEPVHAGDTVNFFAGKNVKLTRYGSDITISAADTAVDKGEIIPATNTTNTNNNGTVMAKDGDGDKFANITNVVNAINSAFWKIGEENSGKPEVKGNVTAGSQVNFSNGVGTIAKVTADEANKTYKVQYDVNAGPGIEISTDENDPNKGKVKVKVDNSTVTINDAGQLVANSAWNANATGNVDGTSAAKTVKANATVNFDAGENLKVKQTGDEANQVYSFSLNQTLTNITSIENKAGGPKLTFGGDSINITGGNLDMGGNKITNLKPGTEGTDAVNLNQLKASRTVVTSTDGSVTVTPSESDLTKTYDLKVNLSNVAKSSWNVKSSAEGGAVAANHNATEKNIADKNTVEFKAGKNLTVEQVNGDNGANVTFALSNNITLDNSGSINIGGTKVKDGDIQIGDTHITNGAVTNLTHHIENPTTVVDDSVLNITDDKKKDAATVRDVLNSGWNLQANGQPVDAVTHGNNVNFASDGSVKITPTTDGNTTTLNLSVNATSVVNQVTGDVSANTTTGKAVVGKDGNENTSADAGNKVATVGDVANTINNTGWITKAKDKDTGAEKNVTVNPGDRVEYVDGNGTTANVTVETKDGQDTVKVTYDVKTDGTTITVKNGNVTANTGNIIEAKPDGDNAGKVTVTTGDENKVATVKNVADAINSAGWIVNTGKADNQDSFKTETGTAKKVGAGDKVNFQAGKNLEVKREGNNIIYATSDDLNVNNITVADNGSIKIGDTAVKNGDIKIGDTHITNGAVTNLTHHIENATTVVDSNVLNISDEKKKEAATVRDVLNSGWNLQANGQPVDAVTHGNNVNFASDGSVKITPTTDGNTTTLNLSVNATSVVNQVTGDVSANTTTGKAVVGKDGNENTSADAGNKVATVGDVANTINNTGWITKAKDKDTGAEKNVTVNPGDRVEYVDGNGTTANVTVETKDGQDTVKVTYDVKTDGTTVTVNDEGNLAVNTGNIIPADDKTEGENAGKVTVKTGDDNKVATVKNVADAINSAGWIVNTGKADNQDSFKTETGTATKVGAGDKVNFQAGKNLEVKREGQNIIYATSEDLDAKTITVTTVKVGKDGKDGVDGSIGVTGKDGAAVAINGKDGSIGLTGPKGADGKDGASVTIKPEKGTTTVAERDGGKEINRVTYTDKDKDGNDIKREIATLDDGLKFTGDDGQTVNRTLGSNLNVKGGATTSTTAKNIRVTKAADGQGLDVNLANNIELDNNGSIKIGDTTVNQDGITINNGPSVTKGGIDAGGKTITNVAPGKNGTDAVNVDQLRGSLTNIQGDIHKARKEGRAGIAGANAAAGLPQVYLPGKSMVAASAGTFKGQNALAVGYSRSSDNGKVIFKLQGNANTQGDVGGSVGIGYQW